jgi:hypothetical protein
MDMVEFHHVQVHQKGLRNGPVSDLQPGFRPQAVGHGVLFYEVRAAREVREKSVQPRDVRDGNIRKPRQAAGPRARCKEGRIDGRNARLNTTGMRQVRVRIHADLDGTEVLLWKLLVVSQQGK